MSISGRPINPSFLAYTGAFRDSAVAGYPLGNGYRWYLPGLMRFNAPDSFSPFGLGGVNHYAYCADDPINHRDPTGHLLEEEIHAIASTSAENAVTQGERDAPIAATQAREASRQASESGPSTSREAAQEHPAHHPRQRRPGSASSAGSRSAESSDEEDMGDLGGHIGELRDRPMRLVIGSIREVDPSNPADVATHMATYREQLRGLKEEAARIPAHLRRQATTSFARVGHMDLVFPPDVVQLRLRAGDLVRSIGRLMTLLRTRDADFRSELAEARYMSDQASAISLYTGPAIYQERAPARFQEN